MNQMCKTCGCAAGTQQLRFQVSKNEQSLEIQALYKDLIGVTGVLQVTTDEKTGQISVDFNPQRATQPELEQRITGAGYTIESVELVEAPHQHSISGFFKKLLGQ
jgi:hypothetical protein